MWFPRRPLSPPLKARLAAVAMAWAPRSVRTWSLHRRQRCRTAPARARFYLLLLRQRLARRTWFRLRLHFLDQVAERVTAAARRLHAELCWQTLLFLLRLP